MSVRRLFRFIIGTIVAAILLAIVLPLIGIPKSHFLPPPMIYGKADGTTQGQITGTRDVPTNDPFRVGDRLYFVDYDFYAKSAHTLGQPKTDEMQVYHGTVRLDDKALFSSAAVGQSVSVKYETTYPWINGLDIEGVGRSCGEGSNILSGWLLWVGIALALGYGLMVLFEQFGNKEDI